MLGLDAPLPVWHDHYGIGLVLAFYPFNDTLRALFVDDQGALREDSIDHFTTEWRFNWNTHTWEEDTGEPDGEASDWGTEISGDVPDADGADGGDPSDEGDGASGSVDTE